MGKSKNGGRSGWVRGDDGTVQPCVSVSRSVYSYDIYPSHTSVYVDPSVTIDLIHFMLPCANNGTGEHVLLH